MGAVLPCGGGASVSCIQFTSPYVCRFVKARAFLCLDACGIDPGSSVSVWLAVDLGIGACQAPILDADVPVVGLNQWRIVTQAPFQSIDTRRAPRAAPVWNYAVLNCNRTG